MEKILYTPDSTERITPPENVPKDRLVIDDIEYMRMLQKQRVADNRAAEGFYDIPAQEAADQRSYSEFDHSIDEYLQTRGISNDSPHYDTYKSIMRNNSIDVVDNDAWMLSQKNDRGEYTASSQREQTMDWLESMQSSPEADNNPEADTSTPDTTERDPAIEGAERKLASLRQDLAEASAKRQGRLFFKGKKYEQAKEAYDEQALTVARLRMSEQDTSGKTDSEMNALAIGYYLQEQNTLRTASKEELAKTKVSKFIEWMTSGDKKTRFAKGVVLGLGGTLVGVAAGAVVGGAAAVGTVAAIGIGAKSATSFARSFARKDQATGRGMDLLGDDHKLSAMQYTEQHTNDTTDREAAVSHYFTSQLEKDTKAEQQKRRKSSYAGLGGIALGAVIGGTAAHLIGSAIDGPDNWRNLNEWGNRSIDPGVHAETPDVDIDTGNGTNSDNGVETQEPVPPSEGVIPPPDVDGEVLSDTPDTADALHDAFGGGESTEANGDIINDASSTIDQGEGFFQTFTEMGITNPYEQQALLHDYSLMNELCAMGVAYPDTAIGGWGINMTPDGKMPEAALELIATHAKQSGFDLAA